MSDFRVLERATRPSRGRPGSAVTRAVTVRGAATDWRVPVTLPTIVEGFGDLVALCEVPLAVSRLPLGGLN